MKVQEFKKIFKPIIKECIKEVLLEEGVLSTIIRESIRSVTPFLLKEQNKKEISNSDDNITQLKIEKKQNNYNYSKEQNNNLNEVKKTLMKSIGGDSYKNLDLFENTKPLSDSQNLNNKENISSNPLRGIDPNDSGVDVEKLFDMNLMSNFLKK